MENLFGAYIYLSILTNFLEEETHEFEINDLPLLLKDRLQLLTISLIEMKI